MPQHFWFGLVFFPKMQLKKPTGVDSVYSVLSAYVAEAGYVGQRNFHIAEANNLLVDEKLGFAKYIFLTSSSKGIYRLL